jgi:uncharacterized phosphosugar-binding protein
VTEREVPGAPAAYLRRTIAILEELAVSQADAIDRAAAAVADAIAGGHRVYVAATSHVLHSELYLRAGGLAAVHTLGEAPDLASPMLSIEAGMLHGDGPFVPEPGDVVIVGTNAGTDAGTVQVAIAAHDAGLTVIGMTCVAYERDPDVVVEHRSGAKLVDLADILIDVGGDVGDAVLDIAGLEERFAPTSGAVLVALAWAILAGAAERLAAAGTPPIVYRSVQLPGGEALFHERRARYARTRDGVDR